MQLQTAEAQRRDRKEGRRESKGHSEAVKAAAVPAGFGASAEWPDEVWPGEAGAAAGSS